jgi:hypothetical protein
VKGKLEKAYRRSIPFRLCCLPLHPENRTYSLLITYLKSDQLTVMLPFISPFLTYFRTVHWQSPQLRNRQ